MLAARMRFAGLALLLTAACDAGPGEPLPPTRIAPPGGFQKQESAPREFKETEAQAEPFLVTWHTGGRWIGVQGNAQRATAWVLDLPSGEGGDPSLKRGQVEGRKLSRWLEELDAATRKTNRLADGDFYEPTFWFELHGRRGAEPIAESCAHEASDAGSTCAAHTVARQVEAFALAEATEAVSWKTEIFIPRPPDDAPSGGVECDERGACARVDRNQHVECYGVENDNFFCVEAPWVNEGSLTRLDPAPRRPLFDSQLYAARLENGLECRFHGTLTRCGETAQPKQTIAGRSRWLVFLAQGEGRNASAGMPLLVSRVQPRSAQLRAGASLPPSESGPFRISISAGNGLSRYRLEAQILGDESGAEAWNLTSMGDREQGTLKKGHLDSNQVKALWTTLSALQWPRLQSVSSRVSDSTGYTLEVERGGIALHVGSHGGCGCFYARPTERAAECPCPTQDAIDAVLAVADALPAAKWTTREIPLPAPPKAGLRVEGECFGRGRCHWGSGDAMRESPACVAGKKPNEAYCFSSPFTGRGQWLRLKRPLETRGKPEAGVWALELSGGRRCVEPPRFEQVGNVRRSLPRELAFLCDDGTKILDVTRAKSTWFATTKGVRGTKGMEPVAVVRFLGTGRSAKK